MSLTIPLPLRTLVIMSACLAAFMPGQASTAWVEPTRGVSIAADEAGNTFTVDYVYALGAEMTVTKRDAEGGLVWTGTYDQTDPTKWERAEWVATDSSGSAITCATMMSGYSNPVRAASVVMKWSAAGSLLWRHVYESAFDGSYTVRCLVDSNDDVYVLGMGSGPAGFVTKVKKFASNGSPLWSYYDVDGIGAPMNFKLTPDGHLLLIGRSIFGSLNGYAKITTAGVRLWALGGIPSLTTGDAAGDAFGQTYLVHASASVNPVTVIRKLDAAGTEIWQTTQAISAFRVEVGTDGFPVLSGFPNSGTPSAAFLKIDDTGALLWANLDADGPLGLLLHAQMILDASNDAYLAAGTLFQMAVCKVRGDGVTAWTLTMGSGSAYAMALGRHDNCIFAVGGATVRVTDPSEGPWTLLGHGLGGTGGTPLLFGTGSLFAGAPFLLDVSGARPGAPLAVVAGTTTVYMPIAGGVLVPAPDLILGGFVTTLSGTWSLPATWPVGVPPGSIFFLQAGIDDPMAPMGIAATNALKFVTP